MTGRRKAKGQAVRAVESVRRAVAHNSRRLSTATTPVERVRAATELTVAVLRHVDPNTAQRHADALVAALTRTTRDLQKEVRG